VFERVVEACIASVDASLIQADANKQRSIAGQDWRKDRDPKGASRAVKECLATLDDTPWGAATDVVPKFVSPSDPAAQGTGAHRGPAFFAYSENYLIDVKFGSSLMSRRLAPLARPRLGGENHDRANRGALRSQAGAARGRYLCVPKTLSELMT
jgi:hypothetical protein